MIDKVKLPNLEKGQMAVSRHIDSNSYLPPFELVLRLLRITHVDLNSSTVNVPCTALKFLMSEILRHIAMDEKWYLDTYLDVRAAALGGDVDFPEMHFRNSGYMEGRFPREMPFDPIFYLNAYADLRSAFDKSDHAGLRHHFETRGYFEGRAGVTEQFEDAERWRLAANAKMPP